MTENSHGFVTLASAGIDRNDSPKFRILAQIPEDKFEAYAVCRASLERGENIFSKTPDRVLTMLCTSAYNKVWKSSDSNAYGAGMNGIPGHQYHQSIVPIRSVGHLTGISLSGRG